MMRPTDRWILHNILCAFLLAVQVASSPRTLAHLRPTASSRGPSRNPGDRHGLFHFVIPHRFFGAVLGPETYGWLVQRFGQATVDKAGVSRALTDDHECGKVGKCREKCLPTEKQDWTLKDLCGHYQCCSVVPARLPRLRNDFGKPVLRPSKLL